MRRIILPFATLLFLSVSCNTSTEENKSREEEGSEKTKTEKEQTSEDQEKSQNDNPERLFGKKITAEAALNTEDFMRQLEGKDSLRAKVSAEVTAVCQKKGCWMDLKLGKKDEMKVRFKNYEFFVPKDISGKTVVIEGVAKRDTVAVDDLKHYAKDAGKTQEEIDAIKNPELRYTFVAEGVMIKE